MGKHLVQSWMSLTFWVSQIFLPSVIIPVYVLQLWFSLRSSSKTWLQINSYSVNYSSYSPNDMPTFSFSVLGLNLLLTLIILSQWFSPSLCCFLFTFTVSFLHPVILTANAFLLLFAWGKPCSGSYILSTILSPLYCLAVVVSWFLPLSRHNVEAELREKQLRERGQRYNKIFCLFPLFPFRNTMQRFKRWKSIS